jgi:hypothetical protein
MTVIDNLKPTSMLRILDAGRGNIGFRSGTCPQKTPKFINWLAVLTSCSGRMSFVRGFSVSLIYHQQSSAINRSRTRATPRT